MKYACLLPMITTLIASVASANAASPPIAPTHLRCEFLTAPLGVDNTNPRLSWQSVSSVRDQRQTAYRILVANNVDDILHHRGNLWDSGKVQSSQSLNVRYQGSRLKSGEQCWWTVELWDKNGKASDISSPSTWQIGLLSPSDWKAKWIAAPTARVSYGPTVSMAPPPYLRSEFNISKPVSHATLYVSALGLYEMHLNGSKVGDQLMAPGWTDYDKRVQYQAYDVTKSIKPGANAIGAVLGDGWYSGYVGYGGARDHYGIDDELIAQINIAYADGTHGTVGTNRNWKYTVGPMQYSDMLMGEAYDARNAIPGWDTVAFDTSTWQPVTHGRAAPRKRTVDVTTQVNALLKDGHVSVLADDNLGGDPAGGVQKSMRIDYTVDGSAHTLTVPEGTRIQLPMPIDGNGTLAIQSAIYGEVSPEVRSVRKLVGTHGPAVRITQYVKPQVITEPTPGVYIFDLGQNMVGWAKLQIQEAAGTRVQMRFAEILNPDGTLYTANLRSARATDVYTCKGSGLETWEPRFTFHGFRYVEMTGIPAKPPLSTITGCVVDSDNPLTGTFTTSNAMVNQLQSNINWSQRGNFLSIPTDCPQRDERLGWMGDAQIFARTATYNRDVAGFYEKWIQDVDDAQSPEGGFSDVSPRQVDLNDGAPAWGDAGIIVPWTVFEAYGDTDVVKNHWPAMEKWLEYITSTNPDGLWITRRNNDFGDWLSIDADTPKDVLATSYYAYDAALMAQMARGIGNKEGAAKYDALFNHIRNAYQKAYVSPDGTIKGDTQTVYVLALRFGLLPEELRKVVAQRLVDNIASKNNHLSTGFVGVGYLCPVLTETGHNDIAYKLLLNDTFPSWGYSIKQGATTIWERWDGYTKDKGFQDPGMNSFNHYSLGSVGQWLYQYVAGIDTDTPGFKHLVLHPHPGPGLSYAQARFDSPYGTVGSDWKVSNGKFVWNVTVPSNTTATLEVPGTGTASVTEGGMPISIDQTSMSGADDLERITMNVGAGTYQVTTSMP